MRSDMAKKVQNVNLLMECARRFSQKPRYSVDWLNALMGRLAFLNEDEVKFEREFRRQVDGI